MVGERERVVCGYRWLLPLLLLVLSGCSDRTHLSQHQIYVFGTLVDITIWGGDERTAAAAVATISTDFQQMHHDWHAWKPGPLVAINQAIAAGRSSPVLPSLIPIIEQSKRLSAASDGLFNPAIGGLLQLWGFQADAPPNGPLPAADAIAAWVESAPSMADVTIDAQGELQSRNRAVQFDFGAFAKGYAVDLAIARLRQAGIEHAIINAGGDLRAIGSKGGKAWRVGIRHPQGEGVLGSLQVSGDEAVFTSGNYERFRAHQGVRYPHILDPRTGWPVQGVTSVTVLHHEGATADAAATALVVAGVTQWPRIAAQLGIRAAMLVDETGTVYLTPAMRQRVNFSEPHPSIIEVALP